MAKAVQVFEVIQMKKEIKDIYREAVLQTRQSMDLNQCFASWKHAVVEIGKIAKTKKEDEWFAAACQRLADVVEEIEALKHPLPPEIFPTDKEMDKYIKEKRKNASKQTDGYTNVIRNSR